MHASPLFLSHWDASIPISVPANVVENLKSYHIMGIRFLYDCFRKTKKGAILNHANGMNYPIQISAFFNALTTFITPESPVLVVCSEESVVAWHYHLTNHGGFDVTFLSATNCEEILSGKVHRVILATADSAKLLREIKESDFFAVVVEELDKVATKTIIKQLKSRFNIGLTNRNFLKHPDQKLFWTMLKWSNPNVVRKLDEFCEEDTDHLLNLRYPYGEWWQRLTWKFCDTFKEPTEEEKEQYDKHLRNWSTQYRLVCKDNSKPKSRRQTHKRKVELEESIKKDVEIKKEEVADDNTHESTKNLPTKSNASKKLAKRLKGSNETFMDNKNTTQNFTDLHKLTQNCSKNLDTSPNLNNSQNSNNSQDTVIYDFKNSPLDDADDNPILTSIISSSGKFETYRTSCEFESDVKEEKTSLSKDDVLSMMFDEPESQTHMEGDDILTSIISSKSNTPELQSQNFFENSSLAKIENSDLQSSGSSSQKNDMLSMLYGETD